MTGTVNKELSSAQREDILNVLRDRFINNMDRHPGIDWAIVQNRLEKDKGKLWSLYEMERTGGEPDVVRFDEMDGSYVFCDLSPESPVGRRSLCYDREALESRKKFKPVSNAVDMAGDMGIDILTEEEYRNLLTFGDFDKKTSSWLKTPPGIRKLGGAIFGDFRYGNVFIYHNGAESYYSVRGFRGILRV